MERPLYRPIQLPVLVSLLAIGCGEGGGGVGPDNGPATVTFEPAVPEAQMVGSTVEVAVVVRNAAGGPVEGEEVVWSATSGGGSTAEGSTRTGADGSAGTRWTLGVGAGAQTLSARVADLTPVVASVEATPGPVAAVEVDPVEVSFVGTKDSTRISVATADQYGNDVGDAVVMWSTSDSGVAGVDDDGWVTAIGHGSAEVVASSGSGSGTVAVRVQEVGSLELSPVADTLGVHTALFLEVTAYDLDGLVVEGAAMAWASSDTARATVDEAGLVRGKGAGEVTITATSYGHSESANLSVYRMLAFSSERDGKWQIHTLHPSGSPLETLTSHDFLIDSSPAWSPDGSRLAFIRGGIPGDLAVIDADGSGLALVTEDVESSPTWAPDGQQFAFVAFDENRNRQIHVVNLDGTGRMEITQDSAFDWFPAWSPDGSTIAFVSDRTGTPQIHAMDPDGGNVVQLTTANEATFMHLSWSPDGSRILYTYYPWWSGDDSKGIYAMNPDGTGATRIYQGDTPYNPVLSRDGSMIAFIDSYNGYRDLFIMNADGTGIVNLTADAAGDQQPAWQ